MVKVRVPATSANLGVGYDCLGLALDDFATVTFEVIAEGLEIAGCEEAYCNEENLFYQAFVKGLQYMGKAFRESASPWIPIFPMPEDLAAAQPVSSQDLLERMPCFITA